MTFTAIASRCRLCPAVSHRDRGSAEEARLVKLALAALHVALRKSDRGGETAHAGSSVRSLWCCP